MLRLAVPSLIVSLVVAACSGSKASSPDAGPTADQACATIAAARCTKLQTCSASDLARRFGDLATCETREALACTAGLAAAMTGNTVTAVEACAAAVDAEACGDFFSKSPPDACRTAMGLEATGAACGFSAQCATGFCAAASDAACGTCAAVPQAGASCASQGCGQDLVCVASTQLCQAPVAIGGMCSRELPCADGGTCVGANAQQNILGTCTADASAVGATCDGKHKTAPDCSADLGLACDSTTNQCATLPLAAAGQPCGQLGTTVTRCTGGATCAIAAGQMAGTCVAPAADGAACDTAAGPGCLTPARCIATTAGGTAGTCQLPGSTTCS